MGTGNQGQGAGGGGVGGGTDWLLKHPQITFPLLAFCFSLKISVNRQTQEEIDALKESASICQQHVFKAQGVCVFLSRLKNIYVITLTICFSRLTCVGPYLQNKAFICLRQLAPPPIRKPEALSKANTPPPQLITQTCGGFLNVNTTTHFFLFFFFCKRKQICTKILWLREKLGHAVQTK